MTLNLRYFEKQNELINRRNGDVAVCLRECVEAFGSDRFTAQTAELGTIMAKPFECDAAPNPVSRAVETLYSWMDGTKNEADARTAAEGFLDLDYWKLTRTLMVNDAYARRNAELQVMAQAYLDALNTDDFNDVHEQATYLMNDMVNARSRFLILDDLIKGSEQWIRGEQKDDISAQTVQADGLNQVKSAAAELRNFTANAIARVRDGKKKLSPEHLAKLKASRTAGAAPETEYSREQVIKAIESVANKVGPLVTTAQFTQHGGDVKLKHVNAHFGTFNNGKEAAGLPRTKRGRRKVTS